MNEHVKHVNADLSKYLEMEHSMYDFVRAHSMLPDIISSFKDMPDNLDRHMEFVHTLDEQMDTIVDRFQDVLDYAIETIEGQ